MSRPDLPRAVAALFAAGAQVNPATQNVSIIEITANLGVKTLPAEAPPVVFIALLVGGQPGKIYTTRFRFMDPAGHTVAEVGGPDLPFTSQIKRVNVWYALQQFPAAKELVKSEGVYKMELVIQDEPVASADLEIVLVPNAPRAVAQ